MSTHQCHFYKLSPFVYWAQTETQITLKVDLVDIETPNVDIQEKNIVCSVYGVGAGGYHKFGFHINFFEDVVPLESFYKIMDSKINFTIKKAKAAWWPRVTAQPQKPQWLKVDFDRWRSEEDYEDEEEQPRNIMNDYPGMYEKLQKEEYGYRKEQAKTVYLIFYNLCQFIGFLYILLVIGIRYHSDGMKSISDTYASVGNAIKFCQILQYLEVMHPYFGYTTGSCLMPFIQITVRNFILFIMIDAEERMQTKPVIFYLFILWSSIEVVRYPYYITLLVNKKISLLTWLRYSLWIPLYPLGILCEGIIVLRNIPYFEETNRFTIDLPNKWNFGFHMPTFMKVYLIVLILPGTYFMMNHMQKTRTKKLLKKKWKET